MIPYTRIIFFKLIDLLPDTMKYISNRLRRITPYPIHERISRLCMKLYRHHTRTILSTVVLLFHEEVQLVQPPKGRAVLLLIIRKRFTQTYKGQSAFMFD